MDNIITKKYIEQHLSDKKPEIDINVILKKIIDLKNDKIESMKIKGTKTEDLSEYYKIVSSFYTSDAKKLLENFRKIGEINKYRVGDPTTNYKETCTFSQFRIWLDDFFDEFGTLSIGLDIKRVHETLVQQGAIMLRRVEEGYRNLLQINEILKKIIDLKDNKIKSIQEEKDKLNTELQKLLHPEEEEKTEDVSTNENNKDNEEKTEKKKYRGGLQVPENYKSRP